MSNSGKGRTVSIYLPTAIVDEVLAESERQERSPSWLLQRAWKIARGRMAKQKGEES